MSSNNPLLRLPTCHWKITIGKTVTIGRSIDSAGVSRSFFLGLFLQRRYRNFADNCLGGADYTTSGVVTLSGNPLHAADAKTHSSSDRSGCCAHEPGGKPPEISA